MLCLKFQEPPVGHVHGVRIQGTKLICIAIIRLMHVNEFRGKLHQLNNYFQQCPIYTIILMIAHRNN